MMMIWERLQEYGAAACSTWWRGLAWVGLVRSSLSDRMLS
jgi:hypothetical protein